MSSDALEETVVWAGRCPVCGLGWSSPVASRQQIRGLVLSHIRNWGRDASHVGKEPRGKLVLRAGDGETVVEIIDSADLPDAQEMTA